MKRLGILLGLMVALCATTALAQYVPIPVEPSGTGCPSDPTQCSGYKTLQDINNRFSGVVGITPTLLNGTSLPSGTAGQFLGYAAAGTTGSAFSLSGDCTASTATLGLVTCTKTSGTAFGALATANAGASLVISGGSLNLNMPGGTLAAHNFATALSATGTLSGAQPAFADISGVASAAQIPLATTSALGGVEVGAAPANEFQTGFNAGTGAPVFAQPSFSNLTGTATQAQVPNPAGDVTGTYAATTVTGLHFGATATPLSSTAPSTGQYLEWNGTDFVGAAGGSGGGNFPATVPTACSSTCNSLVLKASAGTWIGVCWSNTSTTNTYYVDVYDAAAAPSAGTVTAKALSPTAVTPGQAGCSLLHADTVANGAVAVVNTNANPYSLTYDANSDFWLWGNAQ